MQNTGFVMKCEELMIGDWIRIIDDDTDAYFDARVEGIDVLANIYATMPCDETAYPYSADCAKPIPLTPEILEKNFGSALNGCYFEGDEFYELMIHEVNDGTWIIKHDNIEFSNIPRQQVMAGFVHEFQRALRCFGLFDLANNIKI